MMSSSASRSLCSVFSRQVVSVNHTDGDIDSNHMDGDINSSYAPGSNANNNTTVAITNSQECLTYPRDFFALATGKNPVDEEAAALLWQYRKSRPTNGHADTDRPDGAQMLEEIKEIRKSLRKFVIEQYREGLRVSAAVNKMKVGSTAAPPIVTVHFQSILSQLELNDENAKMIYNVFHRFCRDRSWLAACIDKWFLQNNMRLLKPSIEGTIKKKIFPECRGGFTVVAREAKSQAISKWMDYLLKNSGWKVDTTKKNAKYLQSRMIKVDGTTFYVAKRNVEGQPDKSFNSVSYTVIDGFCCELILVIVIT